MNTEEKVKEARRLMFEVSKERKVKAKGVIDNEQCKCGHKRKHHSVSYSINYTEGFCSKCDCEHYLIPTIK